MMMMMFYSTARRGDTIESSCCHLPRGDNCSVDALVRPGHTLVIPSCRKCDRIGG
jgi:hypothetical protein